MSTGQHAIVFSAPERAELVAQNAPDGPLGPDDVTGSTLATLISPGTELAYYRDGPFPHWPGYAAVFRVEAAGSDVTQLKEGDLALCFGPHASHQRRRARDVVPLPAGLDPFVAVFARMMAISMTTLATTAARPPAGVLVSGLGLVGNLASQVFDYCGYSVIACDADERRRGLLPSPSIRKRPSIPVDDLEVALAVECSGDERAVLDCCRVVRKHGEVVLVGVPWRARSTLSAHELLHVVFHRYVVLRSGWEWELALHGTTPGANSVFGNLAAAMSWLAGGTISVSALADDARPDDAQGVYRRLRERRSETLTTTFDWQMTRRAALGEAKP